MVTNIEEQEEEPDPVVGIVIISQDLTAIITVDSDTLPEILDSITPP